MSKYEIKAIPGDEGSSRRYDEFLPPVPFSGFLIANKGSGKTTAIVNLIEMYQDRFEFKAFDKIFVISGSINSDKKWQFLMNKKIIKKKDCLNDFNYEVIADFWKNVCERNGDIENCDKKSYLMIFDDVADKFPTGKENVLKSFCYNHRHPFVSFLLVSQSFKEVPTYARNNPSFWMIYRPDNASEIDKISEEVRGVLNKNEFKKILIKATEKKHSFLMVDYSYKLNPKMKFRRNIDGILDFGNNKLSLDDNDSEEKEEIFKYCKSKTKEKDLVKIKQPKKQKEEKDEDEEEEVEEEISNSINNV